MALRWHLAELLEARRRAPEALAPNWPIALTEAWLASDPPAELDLATLAALCETLGCQPGDLLSYDPESPEEQAARNLSQDLFYQSYLQHRSALEED